MCNQAVERETFVDVIQEPLVSMRDGVLLLITIVAVTIDYHNFVVTAAFSRYPSSRQL